jgi:cytochrome c553
MRTTLSRSTMVLGVVLAVGTWGCDDDSSSPAVTTDGPTDTASAKDGAASDGRAADSGAVVDSGATLDSGPVGADDAADDAADDSAAPAADAAPADAAPDDVAPGDASAGDGGLTLVQARGQYLVDHVIACGDCHTPQRPDGSFDTSKYLAGGTCFIFSSDGKSCRLMSRNLTDDPTGLKNRSNDDIKDMILNGKRPAGAQPLYPVMPYYVFHNMTGDDADAIVAYLRTVKAVSNGIPLRDPLLFIPGPAAPLTLAAIPAVPGEYPAQESAARGKYLAAQVGLCVECHTKHLTPGVGVTTVLDEAKLFQGGEDFSALFPPAFNWRVVSKNITSDMATGAGKLSVADLVKVLHEGSKMDGKPICPPMPAGKMAAYGGLTDADATDIANYIHSLPAKTNDTGANMCVPPPPPADGGAVDAAADAASGNDAAADTAAEDSAGADMSVASDTATDA